MGKTRYCKHISFDLNDRKYLVKEPATIQPVMTADNSTEAFRCSICNTKMPIFYMTGNRVRIKLIAK